MLEQIVSGIAQGIAEWLPISSEGLVVLIKTRFFGSSESIDAIIRCALLLHLGTFLAALIYFRHGVTILVKAIIQFRSQDKDVQNILIFLFASTIISGVLGFGLVKALSQFTGEFNAQSKVITLVVGCLLLVTACLEIKAHNTEYRDFKKLNLVDGIILGIVQGFAALPGLSRSGLTISALLLRKVDKIYALKLSFLMSLPIVLGGNIALNYNVFVWSKESLVGVFFSFIFGLATIHLLLKMAERVNFGYFVFIFGILTILSAII